MPLFESLYNYARWLTRDPHEAEDLVQETYLKGLRGFGSFRDGTNFRAWMYRILRNTFLTSRSGLRATACSSIDDDRSVRSPRATPESLFSAPRECRSAAAGDRSAAAAFREVLLLSDMENMSYREIGETLSIPIGTVTSRLMRARQRCGDDVRGETMNEHLTAQRSSRTPTASWPRSACRTRKTICANAPPARRSSSASCR